MSKVIIKGEDSEFSNIYMVVEGEERDPKEQEKVNVDGLICVDVKMSGDGAVGGVVRIYISKTIKIKKLISMLVKCLKLDEDPEYSELLRQGKRPSMLKRKINIRETEQFGVYGCEELLQNSKASKVLKDNDFVHLLML